MTSRIGRVLRPWSGGVPAQGHGRYMVGVATALHAPRAPSKGIEPSASASVARRSLH